jgi:HAD domain in Swiss Army Knife RNA repair proteins
MEMTKVVFLDLDGVVFNMRSDFLPANRRYRLGDRVAVPVASECDPAAVAMIRCLVTVSQAGVVATSEAVVETELGHSWIEHVLRRAGWYVRPHWHRDWRLTDPLPRNRQWAIREWLDRHPEVTRWVVLSCDPAPSPGWVQVDAEIGMAVQDYRRALMLLDSQDPSFSGPASGWPRWTEAGSMNAVRHWLTQAFAPVPSSRMMNNDPRSDPVMQALNADDPWKHPCGPSGFVTGSEKSS